MQSYSADLLKYFADQNSRYGTSLFIKQQYFMFPYYREAVRELAELGYIIDEEDDVGTVILMRLPIAGTRPEEH